MHAKLDGEFIKCIETPIKQNFNQFHAAKNIKRVSINLACKNIYAWSNEMLLETLIKNLNKTGIEEHRLLLCYIKQA